MINVTYWIYVAKDDDIIHDMLSCGIGKVYKKKEVKKEAGGDKIKFRIKVNNCIFIEIKAFVDSWVKH